jgi:mannose-6-phosphate isomerase-like protein (cupin superfamily)
MNGSDNQAKGPAKQVVVSGNDRDAVEIERPGRLVKHYVGSEEAAQLLSAGTVRFPGGNDSIPHCHDAAEEILYVLSGTGELVCDGEPVPLEPDTYVFIPPGVTHFVRNHGTEEIRFFYAFSPPAVVGTW